MTILIKNNISNDISAQYTGGECHIFAMALYERIQKPVIAIMIKGMPDEEGFSEEMFLHAAVLIDNKIYDDIDGIHEFSPEMQQNIYSSIPLKEGESFDYKVFNLNNNDELELFLSKFPDENDLSVSYQEAFEEALNLIDSTNYLSNISKYKNSKNKKKRLKR